MTTAAPYTSILTATGGNQNLQIVGLDSDANVWPIAQQLPSGDWTAVAAGPFSSGATGVTITEINAGPGNSSYLQVIGLGSNGNPYLPCWQDNNGNWNSSGALPNYESTDAQSLITGVGNDASLQVIGLTEGTSGVPYLACWLSSDGTWSSGRSLPNGASSTKYTSLVTGLGNHSYLQVIGLGTDGCPYLPCWQNSATGVWTAGRGAGHGALPNVTINGKPMTYTSLVTATFTGPNLQVIGLGTDGNAYLVCKQSSSGNWSAGQALTSPVGTPFVQLVAAVASDNTVQVIGLGNDRAPYVAAYLDSSGTWQSGSTFYEGNNTFSMLAVGTGAGGTLQLVGLNRADDNPVVIGAYSKGLGWKTLDKGFD